VFLVELAGTGSLYPLGNAPAKAVTLAGQAKTPRTATGSPHPHGQYPPPVIHQCKNPTFRVGSLHWWSWRVLPPRPPVYLG